MTDLEILNLFLSGRSTADVAVAINYAGDTVQFKAQLDKVERVLRNALKLKQIPL